jgi:hypothetical protein
MQKNNSSETYLWYAKQSDEELTISSYRGKE